MSPREIFALRDYLSPELKGRTLCDARQIVSLTNILEQTCLFGGPRELSGRSVLLTRFIAASAQPRPPTN